MDKPENFWKELVMMSLQTPEDEIACGECMDTLDQYVDLLESGEDPARVLPQLEEHLKVCRCCHTELSALLIAIQSAMTSDS